MEEASKLFNVEIIRLYLLLRQAVMRISCQVIMCYAHLDLGLTEIKIVIEHRCCSLSLDIDMVKPFNILIGRHYLTPSRLTGIEIPASVF